MTDTGHPTPIGELGAEVFLQTLRGQAFRSSNRHVVDYLPRDVAHPIFKALIELTDESVTVPITEAGAERQTVTMRAIRGHLDGFDLVPYLVGEPEDTDGVSNRGTEGFASFLRDHYAVDASRPRLLVVFTEEGIETQKSAQDALADAELVSIDSLLQQVCDRAALDAESPLRRVAEVYRKYQPDEARWPRVVESFERYIDAVAGLTPQEQGAQLPMLGCFLPDARPDFADGERVQVLESKEERRRARGEGRLYDNALLHEFLIGTFEDPIADPEQELNELFDDDPDKAREIAAGGIPGLKTLDLKTFAGMEQRKIKRKKNGFVIESLVVDGAAYSRLSTKGNEKTLAVTAPGSFRVGLDLVRPLNTKKERPQIITWNREARKIQPQIVQGAGDGATSVTFEVEVNPGDTFAVCRLALTKGPRSVRNPIDAILVAVYVGDTPETAIEDSRRLDLENQAWIAEGEPSFVRYTAEGSAAVEIEHQELAVKTEADVEAEVKEVLLKECALVPRVTNEVLETESFDDDKPLFVESLIELGCTTTRRGYGTTRAMRTKDHYLDAIDDIRESGEKYAVDFGGNEIRQVWAHYQGAQDPFLYGQAVAQLLLSPASVRIERGGSEWRLVEAPAANKPAVRTYLEARSTLVTELRALAEKTVSRFRKVPENGAVPLTLLPLHHVRTVIEQALSAWSAGVDDAVSRGESFGADHDLFLQSDTLRVLGAGGDLERVVVLPTHPWLLASLLAFQDTFAKNVRNAMEPRNPLATWKFELKRGEVEQMVPATVMERWYLWQSRAAELVIANSAPFHWEYRPERRTSGRSPMGYVARVVANKIGRYLRMHPHLRDERRTLRIGFLNAGDGAQLLGGLQQWLRNTMTEHAGRVRELPMSEIPAIDLLLFSSSGDVAETGRELEKFFKLQITAADEDVIRQTLLGRIRYRYCKGVGPTSSRDSVHICFLHGLVDVDRQQGKTGLLDEWWDGAFGDGLLATYLRRALPGETRGVFRSRRGLWIDPKSEGMRGGLAKLIALQRGCRDSDLAPDKGIYWECALPNLRELGSTYELSDWVVHLDRELSLEVFRQGHADEQPTIIEYSDQEVPQSPGYDTITATRHATPYREQLGEILTTADLDVSNRSEAAQRSANQLLDDINVLSGSWALDFLLGSIADIRTSMRLKGNVGAALAYRWLRRIEAGAGGSPIIQTPVGEVIPVYVSLEDLLRATPAAGLRQKDGLVFRYSNEVADDTNKEAARWCDDLLVFYLTRTEPGAASRIYGRVIEVKFGKTAAASGVKEKAVAQVRNTWELLQTRLGGKDEHLDAPFRHKQLSLLLKTQLEQAVAMNIFSPEVYDHLNVPALSANLATGAYEVDYTIAHGDQHLSGDAFLLHTAEGSEEEVKIDVVDGVRLLTLPRKIVEWLAFEPADGPTLINLPSSTLPRLGKFKTIDTSTGHSPKPGPDGGPSAPPAAPASPSASAAELPDAGDGSMREATVEEPTSATSVSTAPPDSNDEGADSGAPAVPNDELLSLEDACKLPLKDAPYPDSEVVAAVERLERALVGHKVGLSSSPSPRETDRGPRLLRVYVRLEPGQSINAIRRISEDVARVVGTATSDIHITNVPERHAVGLDLPLPGLTYAVTFDELQSHPSFEAAQRELHLGFCAGVSVTGEPVWVDLAKMPHMLVAGTTGSGKTVFLRNVILTLLLNNSPREMTLRLSSSKPMDFRVFTKADHAKGRDMAKEPAESLQLAHELVHEMDRRYGLLDQAYCDNLIEYNRENPASAEPYLVAVFDEYSEMIASFSDKADRDAYESAIGRLAQKARAAGIHLVICMQRPDANALKGAIKANILHRFALKLPQNQDSRIILDEGGAETLLGQGDLLYKDANNVLSRLQVPFLENTALKHHMKRITEAQSVRGLDPSGEKTCPKCAKAGPVGLMFGFRKMKHTRKDGTVVEVERPQSYCRDCRGL